MSDLKIYVWSNFCPDYSPGLAIAVASSVEEAKAEVLKAYGIGDDYAAWGPFEVFELKPMAFAVGGGS